MGTHFAEMSVFPCDLFFASCPCDIIDNHRQHQCHWDSYDFVSTSCLPYINTQHAILVHIWDVNLSLLHVAVICINFPAT